MRGDVRVRERDCADPCGEPLEPGARGVDLLEVLPAQAGDGRAAGRADLDEPLALELA